MASRKPRAGKAGNQAVNVIIRKEEIVEGGHHGGAWKVAYADFVTAMMAFFLLMWLINATTQAQRIGLADYFSQANVLNRGASGEGKPFGGRTPFDHGALTSDLGAVRVTVGHNPVPPTVPHVPQGEQIRPVNATGEHLANVTTTLQGTAHPGSGAVPSMAPPAAPPARATVAAAVANGGLAPGDLGHRRFAAASHAMKQAIAADPSLRVLSHQVSIHETPQGLEIQIMDTHKRPMFKLGSSEPNAMTGALIRKITPILVKLADPIKISGYTDATPYVGTGQSNWDLSVERANATRRLMEQAGLPKPLVSAVVGYADHDLLLPKTPRAAGNRRVAILVLRPAPVNGVKTYGATAP
ncbi:OmpA family protein [Acidiphilium sp. PA]|uniref:flagellar motor protein MotB n=1 Tax=Acidiphilium sp. PA TaxID=2871705 RepID=UPI00224370E7|nr:flagellar motor protein MotB [Acidiphilium sp. PA]MCW8307406.1 OmpA family protein [Acidiphilium sp. PA]